MPTDEDPPLERTDKGDRVLMDLATNTKSPLVKEMIRTARDKFPDLYGPMSDQQIMDELLIYFSQFCKKDEQ